MAEENNNFNDKVEEFKEDVKDAIQDVKENIDELQDKVQDKIDDIKEDIAEKKEANAEKKEERQEEREARKEEFKAKTDELKDDAKEAYGKAKEKAQATIDQIKANTDDFTEEQDPEDVEKNKWMAVLSYLSILVFVPIFAAKDSKFARFHANQGLVLFIIEVVCSLFIGARVIRLLFRVIYTVAGLCSLVGIIYACQGKAKEIPIIGNIKILK